MSVTKRCRSRYAGRTPRAVQLSLALVREKWCPQCVRSLPFEDFGKDKTRSDGLSCWCFNCRRVDMKWRRGAGLEPQHNSIRYRRNPAMYKAKVYVQRAVRSGKLHKPSLCPECRVPGRTVEGHHHFGYARENWLEVVWRCRSCHKLLHTRGDTFVAKQPRVA